VAPRLQRLETLADLWGKLYLFHPNVAVRELDWEGVLARAIPHDLLKPESGALTPPQVVMLLVAALWYDLHQITSKRNTSKWAVANTAAGIALQIATGMRKSELVLLRC
jgi:integrase